MTLAWTPTQFGSTITAKSALRDHLGDVFYTIVPTWNAEHRAMGITALLCCEPPLKPSGVFECNSVEAAMASASAFEEDNAPPPALFAPGAEKVDAPPEWPAIKPIVVRPALRSMPTAVPELFRQVQG